MTTRNVTIPFFPVAPNAYSQSYLNEVVRSFSVYANQMQNPGDAVFNTLNLINLPTFANNADAIAGDLREGDVYKTSTGELRIVI